MVCKKLKKGRCIVLDEKCKKPYSFKIGLKVCAIAKKKPVKKAKKAKTKKAKKKKKR